MTPTFFFVTLAINEPYLSNALQLFEGVAERVPSARLCITTNIKFDHPRIECNIYDGEWTYGPTKYEFFYALKARSFIPANGMSDWVIYVDSDFELGPGLTEENLMNVVRDIDASNGDWTFERSTTIKDAKMFPDTIGQFASRKIEDLGLNETTMFDGAYIPIESFVILRNGQKFNTFVVKFNELFTYQQFKRIIQYAEGVEMGIAGYCANYVRATPTILNRHLQNSFHFLAGDLVTTITKF